MEEKENEQKKARGLYKAKREKRDKELGRDVYKNLDGRETCRRNRKGAVHTDCLVSSFITFPA